jgi:predicted aldo/keto reductase-like oxidoreductase
MIERAPFGRTGHESSRVIFGAAGIARADQETADRLLPLLIKHGVNHIGTAAMYGDAELRLPLVLAAAEGGPVAVSDEALAVDTTSLDMTPLFDGAELERI